MCENKYIIIYVLHGSVITFQPSPFLCINNNNNFISSILLIVVLHVYNGNKRHIKRATHTQ